VTPEKILARLLTLHPKLLRIAVIASAVSLVAYLVTGDRTWRIIGTIYVCCMVVEPFAIKFGHYALRRAEKEKNK
jgi:hypothetical protein